jgi:glutathione synthase/RimK-type ligase-like ATP-grasp enzyme
MPSGRRKEYNPFRAGSDPALRNHPIVTAWPGYLQRLEALKKVDARLATNPDDVEAHFDRGRLLTDLGRPEEARDAYVEVIKRAPAHFGALNNLGGVLHAGGFRNAARSAYAEAVARNPDNPLGHFNLGNLLREEGDLDGARAEYEATLRLAPDHAEAHRGMALILLENGAEAEAAVHQRAGFRAGAITVLPYRGQQEPVPVLLLVCAAKGNAPFQQLLDDRIFLVTVIVTDFFDPGQPLPPHRMVVNAIGDADLGGAALKSAIAIVARTEAPVINAPAAVLVTGRADNAARLSDIPGVITPATVTISKEALTKPDAYRAIVEQGFSYPFLLRSPGFHIGRHFNLIADEHDLNAAVANLPGKSLSLIRYLDTRAADGKIRKYRVMMIDGQLYPAHLAVSNHWKVHYFSADMADNAEHRAEDEAFLQDMPSVLGPGAMQALERICDRLALDYAGIDFGLDDKGNVLFFEANASMTIHPPPPDERWQFRRAPVARILDAARNMLVERTGAGARLSRA